MKFLVGALAAVTLLVGVSVAQPAQARCFWDGFEWHCWRPHYHGFGTWHFHHRDYVPRWHGDFYVRPY